MSELETALKNEFCRKNYMAKGKGRRVREKGKIRFSSYFKKLEEGDTVALIIDAGVPISVPKRLNGRSGKVIGSRGDFKIIELNEGAKKKNFIVHPIHLRKL